MSLDSHSRRHSLDDPFGESPPSSFASRPPPPPASLSFPRHSPEQRRPNAAGHGQSLSWSGPGDGYAASRQQESYNFPSSSAFRQQQQQQQPAHPLASLMLGGDVAPRTPIDYNSYYTSQASSDAAQPEPRTRDWGSGHQSGGGADGDGDTDSHVFEDWEQGSPMVKEEEEVQDWGEYGEQEHEGGWDIAEVDERQQHWAPRGSEQTSQHGYDTYSTRQRFNNPYPSPYEPSAELPPLAALPSTYGTPPQSSVGFTPSSLPVSTHYTQQDSSYTPQYSTQSLSLSAPEARSYPSFSSFGDFSPTTTAAAQVLYDSRPHQQHSNQLGTPFRSSRPQNRPRAFTSSSVGGQGSLLAPMLEMHHSPTSMSATSSPVFEDYNHPMSMSPQSPISPLELPPLPLPSLDDDNDRYGSDPALRVSTSTLASNRPPSKPVQRRKRGSLPKEVDPKSGRPLSPITGLPTKVIAKRGWPPKDMAKRVYTCPYEGCDRICESSGRSEPS